MISDETLAASAISSGDYERFGLDPTEIAQWEDGVGGSGPGRRADRRESVRGRSA